MSVQYDQGISIIKISKSKESVRTNIVNNLIGESSLDVLKAM